MRAKIIYLKTAFHIIPQDKIAPDSSLLIEIGAASVSMFFFNRDPFKINGLIAYHIDAKENAVSASEQLEGLIARDPLLQQNFSSVDICYNVKEATLIPRAFFAKDLVNDISDLAFGVNGTTENFYDHIRGKDIVNVYRIDKNLVKTMNRLYSFSSSYHSNTLLLCLPYKLNSLYCIVSYDSIKVIFGKDEKLKFTQQFVYSTAADIIYHLLNVLAQYDEDPSKIQLTVSGMINDKSNLYDEVYKYFLSITFDRIPDDLVLPTIFNEYPSHYFSHLIRMVSCV